MTDNFWPQDLWDQRNQGYNFKAAPAHDILRLWLENTFSGKTGACLELGCFPGHYLAVFGELGFELHGLDLTPRVESEMAGWLARRGHRVGEILRADFFTHPFSRQFDVVCSFGLIEHFANWPQALARHAALVAPGGLLAVTTPNFRGGLQHFLHRWLDAENLARHNLEAMIPSRWAGEVQRLGLEVVECGGLGSFDFWAEPQPRQWPEEIALKILLKSRGRLGRLTPPGPLFYAPHCRLLARKPKN